MLLSCRRCRRPPASIFPAVVVIRLESRSGVRADGSPLPPLLPYPLLSVRKRSSLDTTFHPLGSVPIPYLGPETDLDFERWTGVSPPPERYLEFIRPWLVEVVWPRSCVLDSFPSFRTGV